MATKRKKYGGNPPCEAFFTAPHLSPEIIVEIISRLPVKSLCRFRCVSKSWISTISTPQFAKTHLDLALRNNTQMLICFLNHTLYRVDWDSINDGDVSDKGVVAVELDHPLKDDHILSMIERMPNSSNGLVCVINDDLNTLSVINPCTGESRRIPEESFFDYGVHSSCLHGFGYDSMSDDYKLVRIECGVLNIYSLRSGTWRRPEPSCLPRYWSPFGTSCSGERVGELFNGALHWACVIIDDVGDHKGMLLAFDLEEETFRETPFPLLELELLGDVDDVANMRVGVLNGCLCVSSYDCFWLMREYNNGESWTRIREGSVRVKEPVRLDEDGDGSPEITLLQEVRGGLTLGLFEDGSHGVPVGFGFEVVTYVESLISPNAFV